MHNWRTRIQYFMCLETLSCFCISAPVTNTGAMPRQSQAGRSRLHAKGDKAAFLWSRTLANYRICASLNRCWRTCVYMKLFKKRKLDREACRAKLICSPGCVMCRRWKMKGFTHINPINCSNKEILSSPSQMWVMQTFAPVYGMIIIYATS